MTSSLVGSEMCIRDSPLGYDKCEGKAGCGAYQWEGGVELTEVLGMPRDCLLYTSDAADDM
eukprot:11503386-Prorocentrum_lima.AAC.1